MNTSTTVQRTSSSQSTKNDNQSTDSTSSKPLKSTYGILRDSGFRSMNDFMFSHGLKLHNDEHLAQAKEIIERMKEEDLRGEDLRRLKSRGSSDEENVEDNRGMESSEEEVESSEEEDGVVESIGLVEVVGYEDVESSEEEMESSEEEDGVVESIGLVEVVGYEEVESSEEEDSAVESIGFADFYDDQDDFEDDFEDDFFYDS